MTQLVTGYQDRGVVDIGMSIQGRRREVVCSRAVCRRVSVYGQGCLYRCVYTGLSVLGLSSQRCLYRVICNRVSVQGLLYLMCIWGCVYKDVYTGCVYKDVYTRMCV